MTTKVPQSFAFPGGLSVMDDTIWEVGGFLKLTPSNRDSKIRDGRLPSVLLSNGGILLVVPTSMDEIGHMIVIQGTVPTRGHGENNESIFVDTDNAFQLAIAGGQAIIVFEV